MKVSTKWLNDYVKVDDLAVEELAEKINMSTSYISKIEAPNSAMTFSLEVLFEISLALNIDIALLFRPLEFTDISKRIES